MTMPLIISLLLILSHCILAQQGQIHLQHHQQRQQRDDHVSMASTPNPAITIVDGKLYYNNIIYDFRPAFPPYSMEKLNELFLFQRTVTINEREEQGPVEQETQYKQIIVQNDGNIDIAPAAANNDDVVDAGANAGAGVEDVVADMHNNETNTEEERGEGEEEEEEEEIETTATTAILPSEIVAEDDTISLHRQTDEKIADDNVVSNRGNADMDTAVNETTNDSIKEGTSEAKAEDLGEIAEPKAEDVVEAEDNFVEGAASIMQPISIVDDQDDTEREEEKQNHDDEFSTDESNIDSVKSSIDGIKLQQETYSDDDDDDDDDENISSTTTTTPSLSDDGGDNGEATSSVRKDPMVPEVGETNGGDHSFSLVESEQENAEEDGKIIIGGEDSLLVSSEHVSVDDGEESYSTSAQQDDGIVKGDNLNAEESNADGGGDTDVGGDETEHLLSVNHDIPTMDNKEANRQFVDGLDELDKLFEPVEVPDELDVGADGTSMQEVLVGQGLKIIWKNVKRVLFALGGNRSVDDRDEFEKDSVMLSDNGDISVSFDSPIQDEKVQHHQGSIVEAIKKQPTRGKKEGVEMDHRKAKKFFPILIKSPKTQKILKFAKRKFEQAKHILGDLLSIFEGTDIDDDDEFELFGDMGLDDDIRQSVESARKTVALHGGTDERFDDVDESFLKSRFEEMNTATEIVEPVE